MTIKGAIHCTPGMQSSSSFNNFDSCSNGVVQRYDDASGTLEDIMRCGTVKCASCAHTQAGYKHGRRCALLMNTRKQL